jgi:hypothetical protein
VSFSPDESEFITQALKVLKDIPKREVRIDEANVRSMLAVLLSSTRADIGHVAQVAEEMKKSTGNTCGNALSFGMACSAVASVTYRRSLFSPMAYARSVSREDVMTSDSSPHTTRLELVSGGRKCCVASSCSQHSRAVMHVIFRAESVASEGRTAEFASVVEDTDIPATHPVAASHRRTKSEPMTTLPYMEDMGVPGGEDQPAAADASPAKPSNTPQEPEAPGESQQALPHPSSSAQYVLVSLAD